MADGKRVIWDSISTQCITCKETKTCKNVPVLTSQPGSYTMHWIPAPHSHCRAQTETFVQMFWQEKSDKIIAAYSGKSNVLR